MDSLTYVIIAFTTNIMMINQYHACTYYIEYLRFSFTDSRATLYRRLDDTGTDRSSTYSVITDATLDQEVRRIKRVHPNDGECLMAGHLASRGIIASIHRTDPEATAIRRSIAVRRRVYCVPGPN